ncbi:MAG: aspartate ammonia-lyase [Candidatus Zixiibacteriota bacterium]
MDYRIEKDTLGEVKVPARAYYGAQTQRAVENFKVSSLRLPMTFVRAQTIIKRSAVLANMKAGAIDAEKGEAIIKAADEVLAGKLDDQFVVDAFQAGAGTSQNMNVNEVLANRAEELLGGEIGEYKKVHPNDHVNMGQSTNDTIHVAIHIAGYIEIHERLLPAIKNLQSNLEDKAKEFHDIIKTGRTHLQDAVPMRLGHEFEAYSGMVEKSRKKLEEASDSLLELCIGGSAVGTGLNTVSDYQKNIISYINETSGYKFRPAENMFRAFQSLDDIVEVSSALRLLATGLRKIADDLRLLSSGPIAGLGEIKLPPVQPGSSIMPGKINPVMAEMLDMVVFQITGADMTILSAAQAGQLELNVMMPVVGYNLLLEIEILSGGIQSFTKKCVIGITADEEKCRYYAERSSALVTALSPHIGYVRAAELAKESLEKKQSILELALAKKLMTVDSLEKILDLRGLSLRPDEKKY